MKPLCIYHGGCDDGFAAAWTVRKALGDEVEFYPGIYQKEPPQHEARDVIFVDFSYKRPVLEAMADKANSTLAAGSGHERGKTENAIESSITDLTWWAGRDQPSLQAV